jgi:predicted negative regulator of RcsB-dependent stress response
MQFVEQIQDFISSVPKPVIFAVVLLVLVGGFFLWKKMSSKDSETEVEKGALASSVYAQNVARDLDNEREPMLSAASTDFVKEVATGLQDYESAAKDVIGATAPDEDDDSDFDEFE